MPEDDDFKDLPDELSASSGNGRGDDDDFESKIISLDDSSESGSGSQSDDDPDVYELPPTEVEISELEKELLELKKEKNEIYDRLLRKHADFENYRKRIEKDKREFQVYAVSELITELIPILDNFERALAHPEEQSGTDYRKGVELIYRQLRDLLEKRGLRAIETSGEIFDPNFHEAISREERNDLPENTILGEFQKGYFFRDKLLRPAMVTVSFRSEEPEESKIVQSENG
jgi:molecular chaperone GrpE